MTPEITALENRARELKLKRETLYDCLELLSTKADTLTRDLDQIETEKCRLSLEQQSRQAASTGCVDGECG